MWTLSELWKSYCNACYSEHMIASVYHCVCLDSFKQGQTEQSVPSERKAGGEDHGTLP